jgi:thiamine biosynthesis lipoprotein
MKCFCLKKYIAILVLLVALFCVITGCNYDDGVKFVFGTTFEVMSSSSYSSLKKEMYSTLQEMETVFSTQVENSDIYKINSALANEAVAVDSRTIEMLVLSKQLYSLSNGAYNPSVYPLVELWKFSPNTYTGFSATFSLPSDNAISTALALADFDLIVLDEVNNTVTKLNQNIKIDLGAVAKGYAVGVLADLAKAGAYVLINLGGNIYAVGTKTYTIGVAHPRIEETSASYFAKVSLNNSAISTSGDYERYYVLDGKRYSHIIATDGKPADSGVISVTIVGDRPALCDAVATAVVVLGLEEGSTLIESLGLSAIIITDSKTYKLINFEGYGFELCDEEYSVEQ